MGLTLHYTIDGQIRNRVQARRLVERLRARALDLPFARVGRLYVAPRAGKTPSGRTRTVPPWLRQEGTRFVMRGEQCLHAEPEVLACFIVHPAEGSETAWIGLARYPSAIVDHQGRRRPTKLSGWSWQNFCKTQYASNPKYGGMENFLRAHLSLVALLDEAKALGLRVRVSDEGGYWKRRDREALAAEVASWNALVAGFGGKFKDAVAAAGEVTGDIFNFPNFEHLEAKGSERWEDG
jgi:hypothetical protein